jgi:hypothetical protein
VIIAKARIFVTTITACWNLDSWVDYVYRSGWQDGFDSRRGEFTITDDVSEATLNGGQEILVCAIGDPVCRKIIILDLMEIANRLGSSHQG